MTNPRAESDEILLAVEPDLAAADFIDILQRSTLAQRRPVDNKTTIAGMLQHADLIVTARTTAGRLVGVARSVTDFHYCLYLSDLAVDEAFQKQGIGKKLIMFTQQQVGPDTKVILLAAPAAKNYYPHIGMEPHDSCWIAKPGTLTE